MELSSRSKSIEKPMGTVRQSTSATECACKTPKRLPPSKRSGRWRGLTLHGGISSYETEFAAVDSLEEAKYIEPMPEEITPFPSPTATTPLESYSLPPPDTLAAPVDSSMVNPPE